MSVCAWLNEYEEVKPWQVIVFALVCFAAGFASGLCVQVWL